MTLDKQRDPEKWKDVKLLDPDFIKLDSFSDENSETKYEEVSEIIDPNLDVLSFKPEGIKRRPSMKSQRGSVKSFKGY